MTGLAERAPHQRADNGDARRRARRRHERQRSQARASREAAEASSSSTSRCSEIEVPKSPWTTPLIQIQNCERSGASSP